MSILYGVGVGPGDSELITVKGVRLIKEADAVFLPESKGVSTAYLIAEEYLKDKKIVYLQFPMGEDNSDRYKDAAGVISETLGKDGKGVFLTLGDPMTYSTYIYLMNRLKEHKVEVITIPGITSYSAAFAAWGEPAVLKDDGMYLFDGVPDEEILKRVQSAAILKVNKNKEDILDVLERNGFSYVYAKRCTREDEAIIYDRESILSDSDYMTLIVARKKQKEVL